MKSLFSELFRKIKKRIVNRPDPGLAVYKKFYSAASLSSRKFLNVGAGNFSHPYWTNVDAGRDWYQNRNKDSFSHISMNFFDHVPMQVDDNSVELIYCSHTIEHLDDKTVEFLLKDCFRVLKTGGAIRLVAPNIDLAYDAWKRNDIDFFYWVNNKSANENLDKQLLKIPLGQASITQVFLEDFAAAASEIATIGAPKRLSDSEFRKLFESMNYEDALNYCTSFCSVEMQKSYPFRHMNWFNYDKLSKMINDKGFTNIYFSSYL